MMAAASFWQVPAKSLTVDSLWLVGLVTLASGIQITSFARKVGDARRKYKVPPPRVDGDDAFVRCFRAQQNCLEFYPVFLVVTWLSAIFLHQVPAAAAAVYYMVARESYFADYSREAEARLQPFYRSVHAIKALALLSTLGIFNVMVRQVSGFNLIQTLIDAVVPA